MYWKGLVERITLKIRIKSFPSPRADSIPRFKRPDYLFSAGLDRIIEFLYFNEVLVLYDMQTEFQLKLQSRRRTMITATLRTPPFV